MMFLNTPTLHLDPLWGLTDQFASDSRAEKMNLIIGVYRNDAGVCPVMSSVLEAERRLLERAPSKEYIGLSGNLIFNRSMTDLILGQPELIGRATTIQTVAGTGALRMLSELLSVTGPDRTVHLGTPSYVNHRAVLDAAGLRVAEYPVAMNGAIDGDGMLEVARNAKPGDVMLIQGCCHNPTGLSMPDELWDRLAEIMAARGIVPFIDQAYFGLGDGLEQDLAGMRRLLAAVPNAVIAVSASKAWGLYSERTGCAIVLTERAEQGSYARGVMEVIARADYSQPPAHGAQIVAEVLGDDDLRTEWEAELESMRTRLTELRESLVAELDRLHFGGAFARVSEQRGMFLGLPLDEAQMAGMRTEAAIYGLPTGRISIAGTPRSRVPDLATAIAGVARF